MLRSSLVAKSSLLITSIATILLSDINCISAEISSETGKDCFYFLSCLPDKPYHSAAITNTTMFVEHHGWDVLSPEEHASRRPGAPPIYRETSFYKAWLEYSESGEPFGDSQKHSIISKIDKLGAEQRPILIVVYVHGWHHNSNEKEPATKGNNARKFDYFMARQVDQARRLYEQRGIAKTPVVLGIYVGWRGERISNNYPSYTTLRDRAQAADRLGLGRRKEAALKADLRGDLDEIARKLREVDADGKILVVGHSLGGRVLTRAYTDDISSNNFQALGHGFLVVTLNAAVGADCFDKVLAGTSTNVESTKPIWINVTSKDDFSTKTVYWLAGWVPRLSPPSCDKESKARGTAVGHYGKYPTHSLTFTQEDRGPVFGVVGKARAIYSPDGSPAFPPVRAHKEWFRAIANKRTLYDLKCRSSKIERCYDTQDAEVYTMSFTPKAAYSRANVVWNIQTDRNTIDILDERPTRSPQEDISAKHNGYVSTNLTRLLIELIYAP